MNIIGPWGKARTMALFGIAYNQFYYNHRTMGTFLILDCASSKFWNDNEKN
jgi:hypothetical protein